MEGCGARAHRSSIPKTPEAFQHFSTRLRAMQGFFGAWKVLKSRAPGTYLQKDLVDPRLDGDVKRIVASRPAIEGDIDDRIAEGLVHFLEEAAKEAEDDVCEGPAQEGC